jgi:hypothetical protein
MEKPVKTMSCVLVATLVLLCSPAWAGGVKGRLKVGKEFHQYFQSTASSGQPKVDYYWKVENGVLPVKPPTLDVEQSVAVTISRKDGKTPPGFVPEHPEIYGAELVPGIVVAPPKTTLKFHNSDPFVHELYSEDLGKLFEPELQSSQQSRQVQFSNPGVYRIGCKTTPHLQGWVVITPGIVDSKSPGPDGTFLFEDVAPGEYVVKAYFHGEVVAASEIAVEDGDRERDYAEVELELEPPAEQGESGAKDEDAAGGDDAEQEGDEGDEGDKSQGEDG